MIPIEAGSLRFQGGGGKMPLRNLER